MEINVKNQVQNIVKIPNYNRPVQRLLEFDNLLTARQINDNTERLKNDIKNELKENNNNILRHHESVTHYNI